jgi:hypothetical protein
LKAQSVQFYKLQATYVPLKTSEGDFGDGRFNMTQQINTVGKPASGNSIAGEQFSYTPHTVTKTHEYPDEQL